MQKNEKGFLSIVAIIIVVVVSFICMAATYQFISDSRQANNSLNSSQAFYIAQSGIEYAKHLIRNETNTCATSFPNISFANGTFTVLSSLDPTSHQCTITSTGNSPSGKRILQAILKSSGVAPAPVISSGPINITGNATITNSSVSASGSDYSGSTIVSSGAVTIGGSASTVLSTGTSSTASSINADISQNNTSITSSTLWNQFFSSTTTLSSIQNPPTVQITKEKDLNNVPGGKTYFATSSLIINGTDYVGSTSSPAILIINGDLDIKGNLNFYGLLYVTGNLTISGSANITGAVAAVGSISKTTGDAAITFDPNLLNTLYTTNPGSMVLHFYDSPTSLKEIIP